MKRRWILTFCALALAGCSHASAPSLVPQISPNAAAPQADYNKLYSFPGHPGGASPTALTAFDGALYGTTINGGADTFGTVFLRNASGVRMLYSFKGGTDGANPDGMLLALGGELYGATEYGGPSGNGTVFDVGSTGAERVVYSFKGGTDGATPVFAGPVVVDGVLYGTTSAGGDSKCHVDESDGCGVVFSLTTSGTENVLYNFRGEPDGAAPVGSLLDVNGVLYGTTSSGGTYDDGTIFEITTGGAEHVLYSFKGFPDGSVPYAGLTELDGTLYGTTAYGGAFDDSGTVFALTGSGVEQVLHSFKGYPDGAVPYSGLTVADGVLYGTTQFGGGAGHKCTGRGRLGCGTVFSVTTSGEEQVLYTFRGHPDGSTPWAALLDQNGELYGTTLSGGSQNEGSIFSFDASEARTR
jgi:uncharacterized repeat protein (TIGR03803 family)